MSKAEQASSINDVIQTVLDEQVSIDLRPRDIALLVLIKNQIESRPDLSFSVEESELRSLGTRVNNLDIKDASGAEKRLTESLNRLMEADCLARADLNRLVNTEDTEYQLTSLGESIAEWHVEHTKFSGEPLVAILRAFNNQLTEIHLQAAETEDQEIWHSNFLPQMNFVIKDMLVNIQRHQRELDRQHESLRAFIPSLLNENSESSIKLCEERLSHVIKTIDDLQEVTLASSSIAFGLLDQIQYEGERKIIHGVDRVCQDIARRLQSIVQWTSQRAEDWVEHYGVVHSFLRGVIRVDRYRRLTDSLKKAIASPPDWTFVVPNEPKFMRMREDVLQQSRTRIAPRRPRSGYKQTSVEVAEDQLPERLLFILNQSIAMGEARWSAIAKLALAEGATEEEVMSHLPWLMGKMIEAGQLDDSCRDWTSVSSVLTIQELKVNS